jgi:hypothetical protein
MNNRLRASVRSPDEKTAEAALPRQVMARQRGNASFQIVYLIPPRTLRFGPKTICVHL